MTIRRRFALVYLVLAGALAGAGVFGWTVAHGAGGGCGSPTGSEDPLATAVAFLHTTVERVRPNEGYRLLTAADRRMTTCSSWRAGRIPFPVYRRIDWGRSSYKVVAGGTGQLVLRIVLRSQIGVGPARFLLELRQEGLLWRVGFFGRG